MSVAREAGLRTDQAPPIAIPLSFFFTAPAAMVAAGALVLAKGAAAIDSTWSGPALALLHLGTLGFLGAVMIGALYQMIPVVAGAPVGAVRLAHAVHAALVAGVAALASGFLLGSPLAFAAASGSLGFALVAFLVPASAALSRAPVRTDTVQGMRLALLALLLLGAIGAYLAYRRSGPGFLPSWMSVRLIHGMLGLVGWVGGLIAAVSWQVVPMFYLTPPYPAWARRLLLALLAISVVALPASLHAGKGDLLAAAPGALAVWLVHPVLTAKLLRERRRPRRDGSLELWLAGLAAAPLVLVAALLVACMPDDPRPPIFLAWLAIWGWAGAIVHGMLTRIVPFLVWFHRFASTAASASTPSMKELLPDGRARRGLALRTATLAAGLAAIEWRAPWMVGAMGLGLAATGVDLAVTMARAVAYRVPSAAGRG